jgi:hypothetical protein
VSKPRVKFASPDPCFSADPSILNQDVRELTAAVTGRKPAALLEFLVEVQVGRLKTVRRLSAELDRATELWAAGDPQSGARMHRLGVALKLQRSLQGCVQQCVDGIIAVPGIRELLHQEVNRPQNVQFSENDMEQAVRQQMLLLVESACERARAFNIPMPDFNTYGGSPDLEINNSDHKGSGRERPVLHAQQDGRREGK